MKLSTVRAKLTCIPLKSVRRFATLALAGAALAVTAPNLLAQRVAFGVQFGGPQYVAPAPPVVYGQSYYGSPYYGRAYDGPRYDYQRYNGWREHEAWERHEQWEHSRDHGREHEGYGYAPRGNGYRGY